MRMLKSMKTCPNLTRERTMKVLGTVAWVFINGDPKVTPRQGLFINGDPKVTVLPATPEMLINGDPKVSMDGRPAVFINGDPKVKMAGQFLALEWGSQWQVG